MLGKARNMMPPMRHSLLWISLSMLGTAVAAGCGGKVFVDPPGNGGNGGTSSSSSSSSSISMTSTSSGTTVCDCQLFCKTISQCGGITFDECLGFCDQFPPDFKECTCNVGPDCNAINTVCAGMGGSGGGTGGGGGISEQCAQCAGVATEGVCAMQLQACENNASCAQIFNCHNNCGFSPACNQQCDQGPGVGPFFDLIFCAICGECGMSCFDSQIFNYCVVGESPSP